MIDAAIHYSMTKFASHSVFVRRRVLQSDHVVGRE